MLVIRKFVGYTSAAAAIGAAAAVVVFAQTGIAATARPLPEAMTAHGVTLHGTAPVAVTAPSAACTAAFQSLKAAMAADRTEDAAERQAARTSPDLAADATEDQAERAHFRTLFSNIRTACAATRPAVTRTFTPSAQCTAAMRAVKAFWAQGRPTTRAQWTQLFTLLKDARTACGFGSSFGSRWDSR